VPLCSLYGARRITQGRGIMILVLVSRGLWGSHAKISM